MSSEHHELADSLIRSVVRLSRLLRCRLPESPVSLAQLSVLYTLVDKGRMPPGRLAAEEGVQPPSMTRVLAALSGLGYIRRYPHPTDGRQAVIDIMPAGRAVVTEERRERQRWLLPYVEKLSAEERRTLERLIEAFENIADGPTVESVATPPDTVVG